MYKALPYLAGERSSPLRQRAHLRRLVVGATFGSLQRLPGIQVSRRIRRYQTGHGDGGFGRYFRKGILAVCGGRAQLAPTTEGPTAASSCRGDLLLGIQVSRCKKRYQTGHGDGGFGRYFRKEPPCCMRRASAARPYNRGPNWTGHGDGGFGRCVESEFFVVCGGRAQLAPTTGGPTVASSCRGDLLMGIQVSRCIKRYHTWRANAARPYDRGSNCGVLLSGPPMGRPRCLPGIQMSRRMACCSTKLGRRNRRPAAYKLLSFRLLTSDDRPPN